MRSRRRTSGESNEQATSGPSRRRTALRPLAVGVALGGLALSVGLSFAAAAADHGSNDRLLQQVKQAAAALSTALPSVQAQLADALHVATATKSPSTFMQFVGSEVGRTGGFVSISLGERSPTGTREVAHVGANPQIIIDREAPRFFTGLGPSATLAVTHILAGTPPRLGYADFPAGGGRFIVYAESTLPAKRLADSIIRATDVGFSSHPNPVFARRLSADYRAKIR